MDTVHLTIEVRREVARRDEREDAAREGPEQDEDGPRMGFHARDGTAIARENAPFSVYRLK